MTLRRGLGCALCALSVFVGCGGSSTSNGSSGGSGGQAGASGSGGTAGADAGADSSAGSGGTAGAAGTAGSGGSAGVGGSAGAGGSDAGTPVSLAGTEFWAVDLPNERGDVSSEWDKPWAVVVHNVGSSKATVTVEQNDAQVGSPASLSTVTTLTLAPDEVQHIAMPTREVTGQTANTADPPGPPMTELSSNAFRITSDQPLLAYQQNPWSDASSNDGTPLRPTARLGTSYRVFSLPTANPVAVSGVQIPGIPDHSSVTIVGVLPDTSVTVAPDGDVLENSASGVVLSSNGTIKVTLGPFDTLNVASKGASGDLTGTLVQASKPVAVFSSGERVEVPFSAMKPPPPAPPGYDPTALCCTEHFETELPPADAAGTHFVVPKSPARSGGGYIEPDFARIVGTQDGTQITTSLSAPMDQFTLDTGQYRDVWATQSFTVSASAPVMVGQLLASHAFTTQDIGDPSVSLVPDVAWQRSAYAFVAPPGYSADYLVLVSPHGNTLTLDGAALPGACATASIGKLLGVSYDRIQCQVTAGAHHVVGTQPLAAFAYGYSASGSYAIALPGN